MIALHDLTFSYPQAASPAISGINWEVNDGEFVLVAGPSGSGKSTLIRCLNGLIPHFSGGHISGRVEVFGVDAISAGPRLLSRHVGFVAQDPDAQSVLDRVESEIAFALENGAIPAAEMRVRVEETLDLLDLAPLRDRAVQTLSGGERQRLAIAAALALRPRALVLDEPTSQLDPQSAEDVLRALVRLNEDLGLMIVLAEHRLERIVRYADRLTYMESGRIIMDGPVREVLYHIPGPPPIVELARALHWHPLPVTVKEAKQFKVTDLPNPKTLTEERALEHSSPILQVKGLEFSYQGQKVIRSVDLSIMPGEIVALVGRNGAGKSTLLKCIVGLLRGDGGEVLINGRSTRGRDVVDICYEIGYLPQNPDDLLFAETVADEIRITRRNHAMPDTPDDIAGLLERLGLSLVAGAYPRDLSIGQRQRTALGAVTTTRPRLLLLDEPTRGLDRGTKESLVRIWREWQADGAALLIVTHDVELVAMIADRTIMLSQGEVIAAGPTQEVLTSSPHFAPQIARLFPDQRWLTVADALVGLMERQD